MDETPAVQPEMPGEPAHAAPVADGADLRQSPSLGRQLGGDLPCMVCKYNLKGVSIRRSCPECGTLVRATILSMVDPYARELTPIHRPRVVAAGLVAWGIGATLAALLGWLPYATGTHSALWRMALCGSVALSGGGAMVLVRPHASIGLLWRVMAFLGVGLYVPLVWFVWTLSGPSWAFEAGVYPPRTLSTEGPPRALLRVLLDANLIAALLLLRPNARLLVARSLALRMGRVDRQTMLAMVAAASVAGIGDLLAYFGDGAYGSTGDATILFSRIFVVLGSALLTLGCLGVLIDAVRIARAIVVPTRSVLQVIRGDGAK